MYNHYHFLSDYIEAQQDKNHKEALQAITYFNEKSDPERLIQKKILDVRDERNREMMECEETLYAAFQALARERYKRNSPMLDFWCVFDKKELAHHQNSDINSE